MFVNLSKTRWTLSLVLPLVAFIGVAVPRAQAAQIQGIQPEVAASVWQEDDQEVGSVCLNGHELVSFRAAKGSGEAEAKADDLAAKVQTLLDDKNFDVNALLPFRSGNQAVVMVQGNPVLSFDVPTVNLPEAAKENHAQALRASWKLVNEIRDSFGAPTLPQEFLKLSEKIGNDSASIRKLASCFSGTASWYGPHFHGRLTSDGHRFDMNKLTAAHRSLPFGTKLLVMNRKTGNSCVVEVNDRGPFVGDRVLDLSRGAARQLNMLSDGVAPVACLVLGTTN
jgi:rare lipoprotein A